MPHAVLIVEGDHHHRRALAEAVRAAPDLHLAGAVGDLPEGLQQLMQTTPDVLLVNIALPSGSGVELIHHATVHVPGCHTMVVTAVADEHLVMQCIDAGASGYLLQETLGLDIAQQVLALCAGGSPLSPVIARGLLTRLRHHPTEGLRPVATTVTMSSQERTVLNLSAKGYTYEEIAPLLQLSRHTVETYVKRIYRKLQVHSKTAAIYEARKLGLMND